MRIRKATMEDAKAIAKVHVDSWRTTYKGIVPDGFLFVTLTYETRERTWERNLKEQTVYVAENDQREIVGFSVGGKERTGEYASYQGELYAIYILESYQGKGIGKLLVQAVVHDLLELGIHTMLVWVLADNASRRFYEKLGGRELDSAMLNIGGEELKEIAYGWDDVLKVLD